MKTLYITEHGLQLKKRSERIAVKKDGKIIAEYRTDELKRIVIFGNSQVTTELIRFLSEKGVEISYLSFGGKFHCRLVPDFTKNIYLRMAQQSSYRDDNFRVEFSRELVRGKIRNQRNFLVRYRRNRPETDLTPAINSLKKSLDEIDSKNTVQQLKGSEGYASKVYFEAYGKLLLNGFEFRNRVYHPPPDPVNAMLGFAYMLIFNEIAGLLSAFGFDPYLGFLHDLEYGRKSLASDLIEELRSPIADRLVMYLINKKAIGISQFTKNSKGVRMNDDSRKIFLRNYDGFMTTEFLERRTNKLIDFRQVVRTRVENLEDTVLERSKYLPFTMHA